MIGFLRPLSFTRAKAPVPEAIRFALNDQQVIIRFRRNAKAKRMVLRLDRKSGGLVMTLPGRTGLDEARRFIEQSRQWIARTMAKQVPEAEICDGAVILFRGRPHRLRFGGGRRGIVTIEGDAIVVPGEPAHVPRRLSDFLKKAALAELSRASDRYAQRMHAQFKRIAIRDQKSRWGSCSANGTLSYSWRLVLTPEIVLDYVCAHEVAHLLEMNHGPRFWRLVLRHCPHAREAKQWLKTHGPEVHRYL